MNEDLINVRMLTPFRKFIMSVGEIPSAYMDSMTYYEMLNWFCNYLQNEVIPSVNNNASAVTQLQNLYNELKEYVDNYFDNLDVQEEINNKLDDMVERGQLQEIVADYLNSKAIFGFDNVNSMKNATNLINGSYARTLGYYSKNDGGGALYKIRNITNDDIVDDMFIIEMSDDNLIGELIVGDEINIKQLGAYGDGTHDDTNYFKNAINVMNSMNSKTIYIPNGDYIISDTLYLHSYFTLKGEDKYNTKLLQKTNECLNKPLISNNSNNIQFYNISLKNLSLIFNGNRSVDPIIFYNCVNVEIYNCYIQGSSSSRKNSIFITRTDNFNGDNFETKIHECRLSQSSIKLNSTDSYITKNEIWANGQDFAIQMMIATNSIISTNQIVGGDLYGAIYFDNIGEKLNIQIMDNYFDGSYNDIDTKYGIYSDSVLRNCLISNNKFWKQKSGAIKLFNATGIIISNNNFVENDYYNNGESEIYIGTDLNTLVSYSNIISNNSFQRQKCLNATKDAVINRPTTNPPSIIILNQNSGGFPNDIVCNNNVYFEQYYAKISRNNVALKSFGNNNKLFYYDTSDFGINSNALGYKELVFINQPNTNNLYLQLYSINKQHNDFDIANNKVYLITSFYNNDNHFDCNNTIPNSFKLLLNNPTIADNLPSEATNRMSILENIYITTGYRFQRLTTTAKTFTRFQDNGTWSNWV